MPSRATASPPRTATLGAGAVEDVARRLGAVVQRSPADETEVIWLETLDGRVTAADGTDPAEGGTVRRSTIQVRVRERGRVGTYRTGANTQAEVDTAVRQALGQARFARPGPPLPLARPGSNRPVPDGIHDPAVAGLAPDTARDLLHGGRRPGETLTLDWHLLRLVVANSQGLSRATEATALTLTARHGDGPGAGRAAGSARSLGALAAPRILERARDRAASPDPATLESGGGSHAEELPTGDGGGPPLLLYPEAAAVLVQRMADGALSSRSFVPERSFLSGRLGQRVFDPAFTLTDDGTDEAGLPFPFDCDGWPKRPVEMVRDGVLLSPALDLHLGRALDRTPTPHAVGFDESRAGNLFVATGEASQEGLLRAVDGGLAVAALDDFRLTDPARGLFRAIARGVRRVRGGALAEAVADLVWSGSLETVLGELAGVGTHRVNLARHGAWGAVTSPALALTTTAGLETAD